MKLQFIFLCCLSVMLSACQRAKTPSIEPSELLKRATVAAQELSSATLEGSLSVVPGINIEIEGAMQHGGTQMALQLSAEIMGNSIVEGDIVLTEGNLLFFLKQIHEEIAQQLNINDSTTQLTDTWWQLSSGSGEALPMSVVPGSTVLPIDSNIISVVDYKGLVAVEGHNVHHIQTVMNLDTLQHQLTTTGVHANSEQLPNNELTGEMWIDAETFVLHKVIWTGSIQKVTMELELNLRNHNEAEEINIPTTARLFPINLVEHIHSLTTLDTSGQAKE